MLGYVEALPEKESDYRDLIEDYTAFIVAMKKEGEGFRNRFNLNSDEQTTEESPFFNGEAMLALVRSNILYPDEGVEKITTDMFEYISSPRVSFDTSLYLWAMAAIKDMNENEPRPEHVDYARRYTDWRMAGLLGKKPSGHNYCAYAEGLASAYSILEAGLPTTELQKYDGELEFWLSKSADLQVREQDRVRYRASSGEFGEIQDMGKARGGFLTGHDELTQRIDFTQHCLSAYLQKHVDIDGETLRSN
jgi:hypothetical protein